MAKDPVAAGAMPSTMLAHERQVADALMMLDYAIGSGVKAGDGHPISHDIVATIERIASKLGLVDGKPGDAGGASRNALTAAEWAEFDLAYYDLATALAPVTAETLRNTLGKPPGHRTTAEFLWGDSPALRFTRKLWVAALVIAIVVVWSNWYLSIIAVDGDTNPHLRWRTLVELLTPWLYGGLGSCVYLLRSAHTYIYLRTFDVRRKPEYTNRMLLGAMSGGAIILFVNQIAGEEGSVIQLSSAALGFLAGYSTDFLFSTVERIITALLPKIGIDTVQKATPSIKPVDINDLAERLDNAKGSDKDHYKVVMSRLLGLHHKRGGDGK
jgi:hypothetical protein